MSAGLQASMGYAGAKTIPELWEKAPLAAIPTRVLRRLVHTMYFCRRILRKESRILGLVPTEHLSTNDCLYYPKFPKSLWWGFKGVAIQDRQVRPFAKL